MILSDTFKDDRWHWDDLFALGAIIAVCELKTCLPVGSLPMISDQEKAFGDYTPGRFMWILDKVQKLPKPIPVKGAMGLWNIQEFKIKPLPKEV